MAGRRAAVADGFGLGVVLPARPAALANGVVDAFFFTARVRLAAGFRRGALVTTGLADGESTGDGWRFPPPPG